MKKHFAGWVALLAWWSWIICARGCSNPTSTIPRSILCIATFYRTTVQWRWRAACEIRIARGRSSQAVVLDNLREGVLKPDVYDPTVNPLYRDVLSHYGSVALACRVRDPDRKGKVSATEP